MIKQKNYVNNERDIERLFEDTYQRDAAIYHDVVDKMRQIKDRNVSEKLMHKLSSLNLAQLDNQKDTKQNLQKKLTTVTGIGSKPREAKAAAKADAKSKWKGILGSPRMLKEIQQGSTGAQQGYQRDKLMLGKRPHQSWHQVEDERATKRPYGWRDIRERQLIHH